MGIKIMAQLADNAEDSRVDVSGFDLIRPEKKIVKAFGIPYAEEGYHEPTWTACRKIFGRAPDWFFATETPPGGFWNKKPSDWEDVEGGFYADVRSDWADALPRIEKKAVRARILEVTSRPEAFASRTYANPSRYAKGEFQVALSKEVTTENSRTTGHEWSTGITSTVGVEVGGEAVGHKVSASVAVSFGYAYSKQETSTQSTTHSISDSLTASFVDDAPPEAEVIAELMASGGQIKVALDVEYRIINEVCFFFGKKKKAKAMWRFVDASHLLDVMGLPAVVQDTETLSLGFVSDGKVELRDKAGVLK